MKTTFWIILIFAATLLCVFSISGNRFKSNFHEHAQQLKWLAGMHDSIPVNETDLDSLPDVVARYLRYSGIVNKKKISYMHLTHSGKFRPGKGSSFFRIKGEYYLTTKKPSFIWYGKITMIPGITITAVDRYINSEGNLLIKFWSTITLSNSNSPYIAQSAFGRCVNEMTMVPSFFLDSERIKWTRSDSVSADCIITDSDLSVEAQLFFNTDSSLDRMIVYRYFTGYDGEPLLEKFTVKTSGSENHDGLVLPKVYDGYWNLKSGDLHFVHFVVDNVEFN
jgi:hypothetical protein